MSKNGTPDGLAPFSERRPRFHIRVLDTWMLELYVVERSKRKPRISPNTINRYIYSTRTVFNWGAGHKLIPFNPWQEYRKPKENAPIPNLLTVDEFVKVMRDAARHCR